MSAVVTAQRAVFVALDHTRAEAFLVLREFSRLTEQAVCAGVRNLGLRFPFRSITDVSNQIDQKPGAEQDSKRKPYAGSGAPPSYDSRNFQSGAGYRPNRPTDVNYISHK